MSSPKRGRIISSFSYWIERGVDRHLGGELLEALRQLPVTRRRSGSAPEPGRGCRASAGSGSEVLVTSGRPSSPMPPIASVTQVGSPENSSSYSGVRRNRTMRSLMTKSSMSSWANSSVIVPVGEVALACRRRGRSRPGPATSRRRSAPSPPPGRPCTATAPPRARWLAGRRRRSRSAAPSPRAHRGRGSARRALRGRGSRRRWSAGTPARPSPASCARAAGRRRRGRRGGSRR